MLAWFAFPSLRMRVPSMTSDKSSVSAPARAGFGHSLRHGLYLLIEKALRWCINPRLRARLLKLLGARIGRNVRIYEIQLFNLGQGFRNLVLADDIHIGPGCRLDLAGRVVIGTRSTLSPGVTILTHADPGAAHASLLAEYYPPQTSDVCIGSDCWLGANVTVLAGVRIHDLAVAAAGAVVTTDVPAAVVVAGVPARAIKAITKVAKQSGDAAITG